MASRRLAALVAVACASCAASQRSSDEHALDLEVDGLERGLGVRGNGTAPAPLVFEGDIRLTPTLATVIVAALPPDVLEGDHVLPGVQDVVALAASADAEAVASCRDAVCFRWPNGTVPCVVDELSLGEDGAASVREALVDFAAQLPGVTFVERSTENDYVEFFRSPEGGCWSYVGRVGGKQQISLSDSCAALRGVVQHELMHALGFLHEQSRTDRDSFVQVDLSKVPVGKQHNFLKYGVDVLGTSDAPYDLDSVLHYSRTAFTSDGSESIVPRVSAHRIGQRGGPSPCDFAQLDTMYPGATPTPHSCEPIDLVADSSLVVSLPYAESFEDGWGRAYHGTPEPGWWHFSGDSFVRSFGFDTGPADAGDGRYYLLCQLYRFTSSTAIMELPPMLLTNCAPVLHFMYHMYGIDAGTLSVDVLPATEAAWREAWTVSGNQGDEWRVATVELEPYLLGSCSDILTVRFRAETARYGILGDVGLDRVEVIDVSGDPNCQVDVECEGNNACFLTC